MDATDSLDATSTLEESQADMIRYGHDVAGSLYRQAAQAHQDAPDDGRVRAQCHLPSSANKCHHHHDHVRVRHHQEVLAN